MANSINLNDEAYPIVGQVSKRSAPPTSLREDVPCQTCVDREQTSTVYLVLDHHDDVTQTVTLLYQCDEGHNWSEVIDDA